MAGSIPIDLTVNYQRAEGPVAVPRGFGVQRFQAVQERAQVIGSLGAQMSQIANEYAAKNKQADLRADALSAQSQLKSIQTEAQLKASETDDPAEIRQIWNEAHGRYSSWVAGKSEKGIPNVRWSDQQAELVAHADALQTDFQTAAQLRIAEVGKRNSNAKAMQAQQDAELMGDRETIASAVQVRIDNGTLTREEGEIERRVAFLRSDMTIAKTNVLNIEAMEPSKAKEAAAAFERAMLEKEQDGSWAAFEHIQEADRKQLIVHAKEASAAAAYRVEKQKVTETRAAYEAFNKWQLENPDEPITLASTEHLNLPMDARVDIMRSAQKAQADRAKAEKKIATDLEVQKVAEREARALLPEVRAYDRDADKDLSKGFELQNRIDSLPEGHGGFLKRVFSEKYGADASSNPAAKTKAYVLEEISSFMIADEKTETQTDFELGWGKGWTFEEAAKQAALEQDRFLTWVKTDNPTEKEILEYTQTNPRWKALRESRNIRSFMASMPKSAERIGQSSMGGGQRSAVSGVVVGSDDLGYLRELYLEGKK
jgi:hypothetical protein